VVKAAEGYNDPGRFATLIGFEWTSSVNGNNLHRNVVFRDGADKAGQVVPFTTQAPIAVRIRSTCTAGWRTTRPRPAAPRWRWPTTAISPTG